MLEKHEFWSAFCRRTSAMLFCLGNGDKKKRIAFTLTEMLIALVVVAILAVLILPVVTTRAQNKSFALSYESQVKQMLNSLTGLHVMENKTDFKDTMMYVSPETDDYTNTSGAFINKYMKVAKYCGNNNETPGCFAQRYYQYEDNDRKEFDISEMRGACALLKNGASICLRPQAALEGGGVQTISGWLDLNGPKGPNVYGRDLRTFHIDLTDRVAYSEEDPVEITMPEEVVIPGVPNPQPCLSDPTSEACCKNKVPSGIADPCCPWHANPSNPYHKICYPDDEEVEEACLNHSITGPEDGCCELLNDPKCCEASSTSDYCCATANAGSEACCRKGITAGTINLSTDNICCTKYPSIFNDYIELCKPPCKLDEDANRSALGDDWRKGKSVSLYPGGNASYCCDYLSRRKEIIKVGSSAGAGPEDGCCMFEDVYDDKYNVVSSGNCCRLQKFPLTNASQLSELCCSWRFNKKDLDGNSWMKTHSYTANPNDDITQDSKDTSSAALSTGASSTTNKFDSCCPYALSQIAAQSTDSSGKVVWNKNNSAADVWKSGDMEAKVWQNCCSVGSLKSDWEFTPECCHYFVYSSTETGYGLKGLMDINPDTNAKGILRDACCPLDEFKGTPQCCSRTRELDGVNTYRDNEMTTMCCMPNSVYTDTLSQADKPSPWCCVNAGEEILKENHKWFWSNKMEKPKRFDGCCSMGAQTHNYNNSDLGVLEKPLKKYDKWLVNCCSANPWLESDNVTVRTDETGDTTYDSAADFVRGCCTIASENPANVDNWPDDDSELNRDCCVTYGSSGDAGHSRNDKRWWSRCCGSSYSQAKYPDWINKSKISSYKFYYKDGGCCTNVKWVENAETGESCCTAGINGFTGKTLREEHDEYWYSNCCNYDSDYKNAESKGKTGYGVYRSNCCVMDKDWQTDGNRLTTYGYIRTDSNKNQQTYSGEPFNKYCCDVDIAKPDEQDDEDKSGAPSENCCNAFVNNDGMINDWDDNKLSSAYRGRCCRHYAGMREKITDLTCAELWICQANGTNSTDELNNPGYGLPVCCSSLKANNSHDIWRGACCDYPTDYKSNEDYREICCSADPTVDYTRENVANGSQVGLDQNQQYCCKPDIVEAGGTPSENCCHYFKYENPKGKNYTKDNDGKALSEAYQEECCALSTGAISSDTDYCTTCSMRWVTGMDHEKNANAFEDVEWKQWNFAGCCKEIHDSATTFNGKDAKTYATTDTWYENCCNYVGESNDDINKYYGSHEKFREHCCNYDGNGGIVPDPNCSDPITAPANSANCSCWYNDYNEEYWSSVSADKKKACKCEHSIGDYSGSCLNCSSTPDASQAPDCCEEWTESLLGGASYSAAKTACCNDATYKNAHHKFCTGCTKEPSTPVTSACCTLWTETNIGDSYKSACCSAWGEDSGHKTFCCADDTFKNAHYKFCTGCTKHPDSTSVNATCCGRWKDAGDFSGSTYDTVKSACCDLEDYNDEEICTTGGCTADPSTPVSLECCAEWEDQLTDSDYSDVKDACCTAGFESDLCTTPDACPYSAPKNGEGGTITLDCCNKWNGEDIFTDSDYSDTKDACCNLTDFADANTELCASGECELPDVNITEELASSTSVGTGTNSGDVTYTQCYKLKADNAVAGTVTAVYPVTITTTSQSGSSTETSGTPVTLTIASGGTESSDTVCMTTTYKMDGTVEVVSFGEPAVTLPDTECPYHEYDFAGIDPLDPCSTVSTDNATGECCAYWVQAGEEMSDEVKAKCCEDETFAGDNTELCQGKCYATVKFINEGDKVRISGLPQGYAARCAISGYTENDDGHGNISGHKDFSGYWLHFTDNQAASYDTTNNTIDINSINDIKVGKFTGWKGNPVAVPEIGDPQASGTCGDLGDGDCEIQVEVPCDGDEPVIPDPCETVSVANASVTGCCAKWVTDGETLSDEVKAKCCEDETFATGHTDMCSSCSENPSTPVSVQCCTEWGEDKITAADENDVNGTYRTNCCSGWSESGQHKEYCCKNTAFATAHATYCESATCAANPESPVTEKCCGEWVNQLDQNTYNTQRKECCGKANFGKDHKDLCCKYADYSTNFNWKVSSYWDTSSGNAGRVKLEATGVPSADRAKLVLSSIHYKMQCDRYQYNELKEYGAVITGTLSNSLSLQSGTITIPSPSDGVTYANCMNYPIEINYSELKYDGNVIAYPKTSSNVGGDATGTYIKGAPYSFCEEMEEPEQPDVCTEPKRYITEKLVSAQETTGGGYEICYRLISKDSNGNLLPVLSQVSNSYDLEGRDLYDNSVLGGATKTLTIPANGSESTDTLCLTYGYNHAASKAYDVIISSAPTLPTSDCPEYEYSENFNTKVITINVDFNEEYFSENDRCNGAYNPANQTWCDFTAPGRKVNFSAVASEAVPSKVDVYCEYKGTYRDERDGSEDPNWSTGPTITINSGSTSRSVNNFRVEYDNVTGGRYYCGCDPATFTMEKYNSSYDHCELLTPTVDASGNIYILNVKGTPATPTDDCGDTSTWAGFVRCCSDPQNSYWGPNDDTLTRRDNRDANCVCVNYAQDVDSGIHGEDSDYKDACCARGSSDLFWTSRPWHDWDDDYSFICSAQADSCSDLTTWAGLKSCCEDSGNSYWNSHNKSSDCACVDYYNDYATQHGHGDESTYLSACCAKGSSDVFWTSDPLQAQDSSYSYMCNGGEVHWSVVFRNPDNYYNCNGYTGLCEYRQVYFHVNVVSGQSQAADFTAKLSWHRSGNTITKEFVGREYTDWQTLSSSEYYYGFSDMLYSDLTCQIYHNGHLISTDCARGEQAGNMEENTDPYYYHGDSGEYKFANNGLNKFLAKAKAKIASRGVNKLTSRVKTLTPQVLSAFDLQHPTIKLSLWQRFMDKLSAIGEAIANMFREVVAKLFDITIATRGHDPADNIYVKDFNSFVTNSINSADEPQVQKPAEIPVLQSDIAAVKNDNAININNDNKLLAKSHGRLIAERGRLTTASDPVVETPAVKKTTAVQPRPKTIKVDSDRVAKLTKGRFTQGNVAYAGESTTSDDMVLKTGVKPSLLIHCCVPEHNSPTKECCEAFKKNDWKDFEPTGKQKYLSHDFKLRCCNNHNVCPEIKECTLEDVANNTQAYENCTVLADTNNPAKYAPNGGNKCCACLASYRIPGKYGGLNIELKNDESWRKSCCNLAVTSLGDANTYYSTYEEETNQKIGLASTEEFKKHCCMPTVVDGTSHLGSDGSIWSYGSAGKDERCCNYQQDKLGNSSDFCCGVKGLPRNSNWQAETTSADESTEDSAYRKQCCLKNNKYCSCKQGFDKVKENSGVGAYSSLQSLYNGIKANGTSFADGLEKCCANTHKNFSLEGEALWAGTCCPQMVDNSDTTTPAYTKTASILGTDNDNLNFRTYCCAKTTEGGSTYITANGAVFGTSAQDERCCNYSQGMATNSNAFCCAKRALPKNSNWQVETDTTTNATADSSYRNQCCLKDNKYCSCKQAFDKVKSANGATAYSTLQSVYNGLNLNGFSNGLEKCCANTNKKFSLANESLWAGTCCPQMIGEDPNNAKTASILGTENNNQNFRAYCCAAKVTMSNGAVTGSSTQDERCCNYTDPSFANAFCCDKKANKKNTTGTKVEWEVTGNGNEASTYHDKCCSAVDDKYCTCSTLYTKYAGNAATLNSKFKQYGKEDGVTCCHDTYIAKSGENLWKNACCPVAQQYTASVLGDDVTFRSTCCYSNATGVNYSCYYNFAGTCDGNVNSQSTASKDPRCCTSITGAMATDQKGSGNWYCCSNLDANFSTGQAHSNATRTAGCCTDQGTRYGGGTDPACCTYNAGDTNAANANCCKWRSEGTNTNEGAWTQWVGSISGASEPFRKKCCSDVSHSYCTCEYLYGNHASELQSNTDCCDALYKGVNGASARKDEATWKANCCTSSLPEKSRGAYGGALTPEEWMNSCCNGTKSTPYYRNDYTAGRDCCTWRKDHGHFDRAKNDFLNTTDYDACCAMGAWYSSDNTTYKERCCHKDNTTGCCEYMYNNTTAETPARSQTFYPGSPCCINGSAEIQAKPECIDRCTHWANGDGYYYDASGKHEITNDEKRACCDANYDNSTKWKKLCCDVPDSSGNAFYLQDKFNGYSKPCCSYNREASGSNYGRKTYYYNPSETGTCEVSTSTSANCSPYSTFYTSNWYCGTATCSPTNSNDYNEFCCSRTSDSFTEAKLKKAANNGAREWCCNNASGYSSAHSALCNCGNDGNKVLDTDQCCTWWGNHDYSCCSIYNYRTKNSTNKKLCCGSSPNYDGAEWADCCSYWSSESSISGTTAENRCCSGTWGDSHDDFCTCGYNYDSSNKTQQCCRYWWSRLTNAQKDACCEATHDTNYCSSSEDCDVDVTWSISTGTGISTVSVSGTRSGTGSSKLSASFKVAAYVYPDDGSEASNEFSYDFNTGTTHYWSGKTIKFATNCSEYTSTYNCIAYTGSYSSITTSMSGMSVKYDGTEISNNASGSYQSGCTTVWSRK